MGLRVQLAALAAVVVAGGLLVAPAVPAQALTPSLAPARAAGDPLTNRRPPRVTGVARFGRTLTADAGRWSTTPTRVRYQWYRAGAPIDGATAPRYVLAPDDVGRRVRVEVTAKAPGHAPGTARSARPEPVRHRTDVRRVVT